VCPRATYFQRAADDGIAAIKRFTEWTYEGREKGSSHARATCRVIPDGISIRYQESIYGSICNERAQPRLTGWYRRSRKSAFVPVYTETGAFFIVK
jgi:hypothetical protein